MISRTGRCGLLARLLVAVALAVAGSAALLPQAVQSAPATSVSDHAPTNDQPMACYEGLIPGSSRYDAPISTHVYGSACTTRWARLVYDNSSSCCVPYWVKIDRQEYTTYGWLTSHTRVKKVNSQAFGIHNTATVPWFQYSDQRFHACWGAGPTEPLNWQCGPWVN